MERRLAVLVLSLAILALGVFLGRWGTDGTAFAAPDQPATTNPSDKEPSATEEGPEIGPEQREKIALVLDNNGHTGQILGLFFPPDCRELLTASVDCTIRSWDIDTGEPLRVVRPRIGSVSAAAFSKDGNTVALAGKEDNDHVVQLIPLKGDQVKSLKGHTERLLALAISPDGKWLAGLNREGNIRETNLCLWDVEKGTLAKKPLGPGSKEWGLAFDSESKKLMTAGEKHGVWAVPEVSKPELSKVAKKEVLPLAWSPDGKSIAVGRPDGTFLWDVKAETETKLNKMAANAFSFSADAKKLPFIVGHRAGEGHGVRVRDLTKDQEQLFQEPVLFSVGALSPDGQMAAVAGPELDEIWLFQTADGKELHHLVGHALPPNVLAWSPDGKNIAFNYPPGVREPRNARTLLGSIFSLETMSFLPKTGLEGYQRAHLQRDDLRLEQASRITAVVKHGKKKVEVTLKASAPIRCMSFVGPDRAVVGTMTGLELFDTATGKRVCQLLGHDSAVLSVAPSADGPYLLSAGRDMTMRIWDLERAKGLDKDKPVLSLFFAGMRTWVAWTPEGYYAASADGDRLVGWQLDNGPGKLGSFYPVDQFRKVFYRPDVIRLMKEGGNLPKALWLAEKARNPVAQKPPVPENVAEVLPPRVAITSPATNGQRFQKPEMTVEAFAESSGQEAVKTRQLLLDGRPFGPDGGVKSLKDARAGKTAPVSWAIQLPPGRHRLSIAAQTEKSSGTSEELWITNTAPPPQPRLFVLLIGVNEYANFNKLKCAVPDVEALEKSFKANAKLPLFGQVQTKLIKDQEATKVGILKGLEWLNDNVKEEDVAVVCYAGHGETENDQFHLVAVDAVAGKLGITAVSGVELKSRLAALKSRQVLVLLDACHSGAIGLDDLARDLKRSDCGVAVFCAAEGKEYSLENQEEGHGSFTKAMLAGLKGDAGKNKDGEITLARLHAFVEEKVPEYSADKQHPVMVSLGAIRKLALAKLEP
jgi:WD40 repeat protein